MQTSTSDDSGVEQFVASTPEFAHILPDPQLEKLAIKHLESHLRGSRTLHIGDRSHPGPIRTFRVDQVSESRLTGTRLIRLGQFADGILVYGFGASIEMTHDGGLVSINAEVAQPPAMSMADLLTPEDAVRRLSTRLDDSADLSIDPPALVVHFDEGTNDWHIAYLFENVARASPELRRSIPHSLAMTFTYLVDAVTGELLLAFADGAWATSIDDVQAECSGIDANGVTHQFFARQNGEHFELTDPMRRVTAYDLDLEDYAGAQIPKIPIRSASPEWSAPAGISAYINGSRVRDFFKIELDRDGHDDAGAFLIAVINCTHKSADVPPQWDNAIWRKGAIWCGQRLLGDGSLSSYARYLDVIAHEFMHGVIEATSALSYVSESGALNESLADIFGIIVNNWYAVSKSSFSEWQWEFRSLGSDDIALRSLSDPAKFGFPAHMKNRRKLPWHLDAGGVHLNNSIHNHAAYAVMTAKRNDDSFIFSPLEIATLYYLATLRLTKLASFLEMRRTLITVVKGQGSDANRDERIAAIERAYDEVGITEANP